MNGKHLFSIKFFSAFHNPNNILYNLFSIRIFNVLLTFTTNFKDLS